jgi:hypothetical protein
MTMELRDWIGLATIVAAFIAFMAGLVQYRKTQRWKRSEFVAKEVKDFKSDPAVHNALLMLDWNERYVELFPQEQDPARRKALITDALLGHALAPLPDKSAARLHEEFKTEEIAIRAAFDQLFDALERFEYFIQAGLVSRREFDPYLRYWVELIGDRKAGRKPPEVVDSLWSYVDSYSYSGVQKLLRRYGYDIRPARRPRRPAE